MKVIAFDVDDVLLPMSDLWREWVLKVAKYDLLDDKHESWNIKNSANKYLKKRGSNVDVMSFWLNKTLYDGLSIEPNIVNYIKELQDRGNKILFVSRCFAEHKQSKKEMLHRHFDDFVFIDTKYKEYIDADVLIDDSPYNVQHFNSHKSNKFAMLATWYALDFRKSLFTDKYKQYLDHLVEGAIILRNIRDVDEYV